MAATNGRRPPTAAAKYITSTRLNNDRSIMLLPISSDSTITAGAVLYVDKGRHTEFGATRAATSG